MRADRLLGILMYLLDHGKATAAELAERFEASERTIYRDMTALSTAGFPVGAIPGPGGGFSMAEGYTLDRSFLTPAEVLSLMGALGELGEAARGSGLEAALAKFKAIAAGNRPREEGLPPPIAVSLHPWGGTTSGEAMVETIREAIEKRRLLRFAYTGLRGPSGKREAEPFTLALGGTAWYLHAFCRLRGEFRLFRLSRMEGLEVLPQRFDPRARLPVPPVWGSSWGDQESFEIVLRFEPSYRQAALDAFTATELSQEEDGSVLVRFRWPASDSPLRFIMGFGPGLRILAPESLRQALAQAAEDMARRNSG